MIKDGWVPLSAPEKALLIDMLRSSPKPKPVRASHIDALISKLIQAKSYPQITVEVQGGMVQCISGNPFPIRICDYDIQGQDDLHIDSRGKPCRMSFKPTDPEMYPRSKRSRSKITPLA
jgi:hypothetical protein